MKFFNRILKLGSIYQFDGGQSYVQDIELSRPVQLVHDVSREAEFATGVGIGEGWGVATSTVVHAGVGSIDTDFNLVPFVGTAFPGADLALSDCWLFDTFLLTSVAGSFTSAWARGPSGAGQNSNKIWRRWTGELATAGATGNNNAIPTYEYPRPVKLNFNSAAGCILGLTTTVALAVTVTIGNSFWLGAKGALPPHVA